MRKVHWKLDGIRMWVWGWTLFFLFLTAAPLFAQNAVTVTNSAPDESNGSFGWAVTTLNASGSAGAITFASDTYPTLTLTLPAITQSVTFNGGGLYLTGQNGTESQLLFQQAFTQNNMLQLTNNGVGTGMDASVTAASWTMASNVNATLQATPGAGVSIAGGIGATGKNGGNAAVTVGTWTTGQAVALNAGAGGSVTDTGGSGDKGGTGGSASVTAVSILVPGSNFLLSAGAGGSVTDLGVGTNQGGNGGSAIVQSGLVSIGNFSTFTLNGGLGGQGVTGGAGGSATLLSSAVSVVSSLTLQAGNGGNGVSIGGAGGNASLSFTNLTQSASNRYLYVTGGNGGYSSSTGGNGGNAMVSGTGVSLTGNSGFQVTGGSGGSYGYGPGGTVNGGNGGSAALSLSGFFSDSSNAYVTVSGGNGGAGSSGTTAGAGGTGGSTNLTLNTFSITGATQIILGGGKGGNGGNNTASGTGGAGGAGGNLAVTLGSLTLNSGSSLTLMGNSGGAGGNSTSGTGGAGGNGGNITFTAGSVTLAAGDNLVFTGGTGGAGGMGTISGANGAVGQISVTAGNIFNQGNFFLNGTNALLQVGGAYSQVSGSNLHLVLGGSGAVSSGFVSVGGTAQMAGGLVLTAGGGLTAPVVGQSVTLLTAGSLTGQFDNVQESLSGMRLLPIYNPQQLLFESINTSFQSAGTTPNQKAIAVDLDTVALKPQVNGLMVSIGAASNAVLQAAYNQLSPEDFTALYQAGFEGALARTALVGQRLSQLMDQVDNTPWLPGFSNSGTPWFAANLSSAKEATMAPKKADPWSGFVSGNGGSFNVSGDSNAAGYKVTTYGLTGAGADYRLSREMMAGLLLGYGHTDVNLGSGGTLTVDGGQVGLYGLFYSEGFYASALAEGGINNYGTQRQAYGGTATGKAQGFQYDGVLELGYQFKQGQVKVGPMASAQYSNVSMNGFTEQGSLAPLTVPAQSLNSFLSRLGVRADSHWSLGSDAALVPSLQLAWEHEFNYQGGTIQAGFGAGDGFTVAGPQIGQDGLLAGASMGLNLAKTWTLSLQYQGEFGRTNLTSNQFGGGLRFGF